MPSRFLTYFRLALLAFVSAWLAGCLFDNSSDTKTQTSRFVGMPLDSLDGAVQLLMRGNSLLIANRDSADPGIALVDTGTETIAAYYSELLPPTGMAKTADSQIIITESNYTQGAVSVLDLDSRVLRQSVISMDQNNSISAADGMVFLFDRTAMVVTGFTGDMPGQNVVLNAQTGAGSDPQDISIVDGSAFIPRYDLNSLLILDPTKLDGGARDSIDLGAYDSQTPPDSAATVPDMALTTAYNGYVFVALQRLNYDYQALDTSLVVVIDAASKKVVATIPLQFKNPFSAHVVGNLWYLTCIANYAGDGGVEKIDLDQRVDAGVIVSAQSLGGNIFDFFPAGNHTGYIAYGPGYGFVTQVKRISF